MDPEVGEAPKDSDDMKFAKAIIEKKFDLDDDEFAYLLNEGNLKIFTFEKNVSDCINYVIERSDESLLYTYFRYLFSEKNDGKLFFDAFEQYVPLLLLYRTTSFSTQQEIDETFARLEALYIVAALNYPVDEANFRKRYRLPPKTKANELPLKCFMANRLFNMHLEEYLARTESSFNASFGFATVADECKACDTFMRMDYNGKEVSYAVFYGRTFDEFLKLLEEEKKKNKGHS